MATLKTGQTHEHNCFDLPKIKQRSGATSDSSDKSNQDENPPQRDRHPRLRSGSPDLCCCSGWVMSPGGTPLLLWRWDIIRLLGFALWVLESNVEHRGSSWGGSEPRPLSRCPPADIILTLQASPHLHQRLNIPYIMRLFPWRCRCGS